MKPLDWLLLIIGSLYLWLFLSGFFHTELYVFKAAPEHVWKILSRRMLMAGLCFGLVLYRMWG